MKISEELKKAYAENIKVSKKKEKEAIKIKKQIDDAKMSEKLQNSADVSVTNANMRTLIVNTTCEDLKIAFNSIFNSDQFFATLYNELQTNEKVIRAQNQRAEKAKKRKNDKSNSALLVDNAASNAFNALDYNDTESIISMDSDHKDPRTKY